MAQVRSLPQGGLAKLIRAGSACVGAGFLMLLGLAANGSDRNRALIPVAHVVMWTAFGLGVLILAIGAILHLRDRGPER